MEKAGYFVFKGLPHSPLYPNYLIDVWLLTNEISIDTWELLDKCADRNAH